MSKAVIYIDTEDDITSIIDRVKGSSSDIIALVPPKRVGVLQSVVNLKLLKRAAAGEKKRVVLITNDQSLVSLAGGASIPTAKNLQSRPEIATIGALEVDNNDVIDGGELPVGEVNDALGKDKAPVKTADSSSDASAAAAMSEMAPLKNTDKGKPEKNGLKVPDFLKFRKRLIIGGVALVALLIFLWWALWVAPSATVAITARTEAVNVDRPLTLDPDALQSDAEDSTLKPVVQQIKKSNSVEFEATGEKEVGEKASGTAVIRNCESRNAITVPAGTALSANGLNFITASSVEVPGGSSSSDFGGCDTPGRASVEINAQNIGKQYNLPGGTQFAVAGFGGDVSGVTENGTSGGSKRQVSVVSEGDVTAAREKAAGQDDAAAKQELAEKFEDGYRIVEESFEASVGQASVNPEVGAEASNATLTVETTYTMAAINHKDLNRVLDAAINDEIGDNEQKTIYENGREDLEISEFQELDDGSATMRIKTTGYIGAEIDEEQIKEDISGKRYGEIEARIKEVPNVESVDISFSPFWVTSAPEKEKIELKFDIITNEQD